MGQNETHYYVDRSRPARTTTNTFQQPHAVPSYPNPADVSRHSQPSQPSSNYPYAPSPPAAPHNPGLDIERLKNAFQTWSQGTSLNKTKFNNALGLLEEFGFKSLRDTPLGNRLFEVFDSSRDGEVSEGEFINGMSAILREDAANKRLEYTFRAYDDGNTGYVTWNSLSYMIESSWIAAFRKLAVRAKDKNYLTSFQFETWSQTQLGPLKSMLYAEFQQLDPGQTGKLDKPGFFRWAAQDHTIVAEIGQIKVEVPVSLAHMAEPKIEYPSF